MKKLALFILLCILTACEKYPDNSAIDGDLKLGESVFYLNGVEQSIKWEKNFSWDTFYHRPILSLVLREKDDLVITGLNFENFDYTVLGSHDIQCNSQIFRQGVFISLGQIVDEDLSGYEYELQTDENNMFDLVAFDTINKTIDFKFRTYFKRGSKRENIYSTDAEWPKYIKFEGHFHNYYN